MNYRLNFILMLLVFSTVTFMVCMTYENMDSINVQTKLQEIGLLEGTTHALVPVRKPNPMLASVQ